MFDVIGIPDRKTGFPYAVVCLIFELCDRDLNHLFFDDLNDGYWRPSEEFTRHWFAQLALAVAYLHSHQIRHNDIYARNIFVQFTEPSIPDLLERFHSSVVKLGDLGVAEDCSKYKSPRDLRNMLSEDIHLLGNELKSLTQYQQKKGQIY